MEDFIHILGGLFLIIQFIIIFLLIFIKKIYYRLLILIINIIYGIILIANGDVFGGPDFGDLIMGAICLVFIALSILGILIMTAVHLTNKEKKSAG